MQPDNTPRRLILAHLPLLDVTGDAFAALMARDCKAQRSAGRTLPPKTIVGVNGQVVAMTGCDQKLQEMMAQIDYLVADGMSLCFASGLFYKPPLPERVSMTDFFHVAAAKAQEESLSFYILGNTPENHAQAMARVAALYPRLRIAGHRHGYWTPDEEADVVAALAASQADVLWVGMGFPRQEAFVVRHKAALQGLGWIVTCGGLFDHVIGAFPRAPRWMQRAGLEWLHRLLCEPRRLFWRYAVTNIQALWFLLTGSGDRRA